LRRTSPRIYSSGTLSRFSLVKAVDCVRTCLLISLFITCYNDTLFPNTGKAVVALLERLGHTMEFRSAQTCCGQMHYNTGYQREAMPMMQHFLETFRTAETICIPSSSCVAMMRDHYPKMAARSGDPVLVRAIDDLLPKVFELSELLVDKLGVTDVGAFYPHTVTMHPSCHSIRSLHLGSKPFELLKHVRGLSYAEMPEADQCCGFGGTFAIKNADVSAAMLSDKVRCVLSTQAEVCTAVDNSCLMHIAGALSRQRAGVKCVHLAEILASTEEGEAT
jgi:L-lactate dehydrogenase complex protein LldE